MEMFLKILSNIPKKKKFTMREFLKEIEDNLFELVNSTLHEFFVNESNEQWEKPIITNPNADFIEEAEKNYKSYLENSIKDVKNKKENIPDLIEQVLDYDLTTKISNLLAGDIVKKFLKYYDMFKYDSKNLRPVNRMTF